MAFQPCPGIASLTVAANSSTSTDTFQNILHFAKNDLSNWSPSEVAGLANDFDTWLATGEGTDAMLTHLSTGVTIESLIARDLSVDGGPETIKTVSHNGLDSAANLNDGLSFAVSLRTGKSGRSFRGRIFAFGLTHSWNGSSQNNVDSTIAGDVVTGWTNLITVAAGWTPALKWVVLSRRHKVGDVPNVQRATGLGTPITEVGYSNLVLDFQRRRAPYHSRHN